MFSQFLNNKKPLLRELVNRLNKRYKYVSLLGKHVVGRTIRVTSSVTSTGDSMECQCGFVVKIYQGDIYSEYSFSDINENSIDELEKNIVSSINLDQALREKHVHYGPIEEEPLKKDFIRPIEGRTLATNEIIVRLNKVKDKAHAYSPLIMQVYAIYTDQDISAIFISKNKELTQNYFWANTMFVAIARKDNNIKDNYIGFGENSQEKVLDQIEKCVDENCQLAIDLLDSTLIEPGVYDIITDQSITGLIAHEAFGHGVEMDMYVKDRAMSKYYINKPVASPLVEMHDGAASTLSVASYFFDDDGVLAHDTTIIKNGILQTGISDVLSAMQLGNKPTGNGRRESYKRKAYTRMTNTFFSKGKDKLEDMIKSIKHGYMLFQTNNGMEDPKNWNIQCTASYGREIKDGKFTGKIVSPVCMSGYVPDLLKSISMVSDDFVVTGAGHCGKGHKEWVCVSDGGPCLKARCKLG